MSPADGDGASGIRDRGGYDPFAARRAKVLDPGRATRRVGQALESTVYLSDRVLVAGVPSSAGVAAFQRFAEDQGISARADPRNEQPPSDDGPDARMWVTALVLDSLAPRPSMSMPGA